jgi:predicted RNase H-like HicB family nuclease
MRKKTMPKSAKRLAQVTVQVQVKILKEGDYLVAYCPMLELSSYGKTLEEAKQGFEGAMRIFIEETAKRGTLERELLSLGWTLRQKPSCEYRPPASLPGSAAARRLRTADVIREYSESVRIPCDPPERGLAYASLS